MAKDAFWFSHDANARNDPKILDMRSKYGSQGYGWYWMLIEMLREQSDYKLKQCKCNAYAMQMNCQPDAISAFISDCIGEFGLFGSDGEHFWSDSLLRRMANKDRVSETRTLAAQKRWADAQAMHMHSKPGANAEQNDAIRKEEKREEENKKDSTAKAVNRFMPPAVEEVAAYCRERGNGIDPQEFVAFYTSKGWLIGKSPMKDWKATVWTWERKRRGANGATQQNWTAATQRDTLPDAKDVLEDWMK